MMNFKRTVPLLLSFLVFLLLAGCAQPGAPAESTPAAPAVTQATAQGQPESPAQTQAAPAPSQTTAPSQTAALAGSPSPAATAGMTLEIQATEVYSTGVALATAVLGTPQPPFEAAVYRDEAAGFELDYPAGWTVVPIQRIGSRGSQGLLLSPGTTAEALAEGGTRVGLTIYNWDPKNDLDAFVAQRKNAWEASGFLFVSQASYQLADGRPAVDFIVETPEKQQVFFSFTTVGEDYLQISAEGDLELAGEIAHTLRPSNQ